MYKKYIKRNGKLYGPYIYHSRRVNGKVVSEYQGTGKKIEYKKFIFIFLGVVLILAASYGMLSNKTTFTGNVVAELRGDNPELLTLRELEGSLDFSLTQGEFLPADSKVSFETSKGNYTEYGLKDLIEEESIEGEFYIQDKTLVGVGEGYGLIGETEIYPIVNFSLRIYSVLEEPNDKQILFGEVSVETPFVYVLEPNQTAEIISSSQNVGMNIEGKEIIITTNYSEIKKGFGEEYLGDEEKILSIDLSELHLVVEGEIKVTLVYENKEIISLGNLQQEEVIEVVEEEVSEGVSLIEEINFIKDVSSLSEEEKQILIVEFDDEKIQSEVNLFNERIIVRYEYGVMWIENSYDSELTKEELETQMELDRINWLRDLIKQILEEETQAQELEGFENNYLI